MLCVGLSISCIIVAAWRVVNSVCHYTIIALCEPHFMGPSLSAMYVMYCCYCHVPLLLSGDHASCGSCRQCMSCTIVTVWRPCFVRVLLTVYVMYYCYCLLCGLVDSIIMSCYCLATMLHAGPINSVCHVLS